MSKNSFADYARTKRPLINKQVKALIKQQQKTARQQNAPYRELIKQIDRLVARGGKRLRPLLCLLAYEGYGGRRHQAIMQVAASQELLHSFFLIHDDIIDRDYHRWGGHNILGVYFDRYSQTMMPRDALHAAEAQALLAGDTCAALSAEALLSSDFEPAKLIRAQQLQQQTVLAVIGGEVAEVAYPLARNLPTEEQVIQVYRDKTASYSLGLPLQLGAMLAGASHHELGLLANFANHHGVAFQLQDDLLGMFGDEAITGKSALSDLREGRRTILVLKALERSAPAVRRRLLGLLGSDSADTAALQLAQTIITETGARDYVEALAEKYTQMALGYLNQTTMNQAGKQRLTSLVAQLSKRDH